MLFGNWLSNGKMYSLARLSRSGSLPSILYRKSLKKGQNQEPSVKELRLGIENEG